MKTEEFDLVEQAVKTGIAPAEIVDAFNELTALRKQLKSFGEPDSYYLKAMNCPHHHRIFAAQPRSYRDLPLRLAEYGTCYRYEQSGELFGLMRVRSLNMNDAHIYCQPEKFAEEFNAVNEMYLKYFKTFGIEKYVMRFSTHDPARLTGDNAKFVNEPELWKQTEDMVRDTLKNSGINYVEVPNEAAFYGPKIDVQVWSVIGREFTLATNQVDFAVPKRFGLVYKDRDNTEKTPLCIHRAPLGTHERFIGFLIEHYAGNFPLWLVNEFGVVAGQARWIVSAETHDVFLNAENFEILQIHVVDPIEFLGELVLCAIDVRVVHVERTHAHQPEQFAALLVTITTAVFRQPEREIAITARFRREDAVMMRAVHRSEIIPFRLPEAF